MQSFPTSNEIVKGSTAQILVALYKTAMGFKDIPSDDPMLKRFVVLDAKTTQAKNLVTLPTTITEKQEDLSVYLSRISEASRQRGAGNTAAVMNQAYAMYTETVNNLNKRATELNAQQEALLHRYRRMVQEQHEAVADLIQQKPKGSVTVSDIERLLKTFEKEVATYTKDRKNLENDYEKVVRETSKLVEATGPKVSQGVRPESPG